MRCISCLEACRSQNVCGLRDCTASGASDGPMKTPIALEEPGYIPASTAHEDCSVSDGLHGGRSCWVCAKDQWITCMLMQKTDRAGRLPGWCLTKDKDCNIIKSDRGLKIRLDGEEQLEDVPWGHGLLGTGNSFSTTCHQVGGKQDMNWQTRNDWVWLQVMVPEGHLSVRPVITWQSLGSKAEVSATDMPPCSGLRPPCRTGPRPRVGHHSATATSRAPEAP